MPVLWTRRVPEGRSGSGDEDRTRTYTDIYRVRTDDVLDGPLVAVNAVGIPRFGDPYIDSAGNFDHGVRCKKISVAPDQEDPQQWLVTVEHGSDQPGETKRDPNQMTENPLLRLAEVSVSSESTKRPLEVDLDGEALLNSAFDPFDPPYEDDDFRQVYQVTKNMSSFNDLESFEYLGAINSDTFLGSGPGTWRMRDYSGQSSFENDVYYWKVTLKLERSKKPFAVKLLDAGYQGFVGGLTPGQGFKRVVLLDPNGQAYTQPVLLDGNGSALDPNKVATGETPPVYLPFNIYRAKPFGTLLDGLEDLINNALAGRGG
jgi:hypothetical protein